MEYILICLVAVIVAAMTLFSGFGLGTLLMPVFALFFPVPVAIAATALVHLANNIFKVALLGRNANRRVVLQFALPAALAAIGGALLLQFMSGIKPLVRYSLADKIFEITLVKVVIAILIIIFAVLELTPRFEKLSFKPKYVPLGGILSGFFGGLSGHQGALRTAFLIRLGMPKEVFLATMVVSAVVVDIARLIVYRSTILNDSFLTISQNGRSVWSLIIAGTIAAFLGSFLGARLIKKVTMRSIQILIGIMLLLLGAALGSGLI
jgi:hypothetical protein